MTVRRPSRDLQPSNAEIFIFHIFRKSNFDFHKYRINWEPVEFLVDSRSSRRKHEYNCLFPSADPAREDFAICFGQWDLLVFWPDFQYSISNQTIGWTETFGYLINFLSLSGFHHDSKDRQPRTRNLCCIYEPRQSARMGSVGGKQVSDFCSNPL